jgi:hypothetical protein
VGHVARTRDMKNTYKIVGKSQNKSEVRIRSRGLEAIRSMLQKQDVRAWYGFSRLRTGIIALLLRKR